MLQNRRSIELKISFAISVCIFTPSSSFIVLAGGAIAKTVAAGEKVADSAEQIAKKTKILLTGWFEKIT
jgi:hypothetical protein